MSSARRVRVPERGRAEIDQRDWDQLRAQPGFWRLVESKVVAVSQTRRGGAELVGRGYVGRALFGDISLEITEKTPGSLSALIGFGTRGAFKVAKVSAPITDLGKLIGLVIHEFLESLRDYASKGRDREFRRRRAVGSLVGGRLDVVRTIALRARGARHLAAFSQDRVVFTTPKNKVLAVALREIDRLSRVFDLDQDDVVTARSFGILFSDCVDAEVLTREIGFFLDMTERLLADRSRKPDDDLLNLAAVLLSRSSFEDSATERGTGPRAWFINLETLFEKAVRGSLAQVATHLRVRRWADWQERLIFRDSFRAEPDVVLAENHEVVAIADAKYKVFSMPARRDEGLADFHSDVYQLLAHAVAFETKKAFLVFPGDDFSQIDLGTSATGCEVSVFVMRVMDLSADAAKALVGLGLLPVASDLVAV